MASAVVHATECNAHQSLVAAAKTIPHLRDLLRDEARNKQLMFKLVSPDEGECFWFDFSRQNVTNTEVKLLLQLADECNLEKKIQQMFLGEKINSTEGRAVLHMALRANKNPSLRPNPQYFKSDGVDVVPIVQKVLEQIEAFSVAIRSGEGRNGKGLKDVICIGIGGSYLGPEFIFEALRSCGRYSSRCTGRRLRFLANVDPVDFCRVVDGFDPKSTLVIIVSKTFTTRETMMNARAVRDWLLAGLKGDEDSLGQHMAAVSTNIQATTSFGIPESNIFPFWDWVGGRFSACSAVGCLPLALHFGMETVHEFLSGCRLVDNHFASEPLASNIPVLMGLFSVWNTSYRQMPATAVLPYSEALSRFPAHVQQLAMESNGKRCCTDGRVIPDMNFTGEVIFGEPGTNGQHSFYQLLHQGRRMACDFIAVCCSPIVVDKDSRKFKDQHDELMSNFFAQPDALAIGLPVEEISAQFDSPQQVQPRVFPGDRPSSSLLMKTLSAFSVGMLLALYEHRTAVQGFIFGINSFDQFGVELGKVLAKDVKEYIDNARQVQVDEAMNRRFTSSTREMINLYVDQSNKSIS